MVLDTVVHGYKAKKKNKTITETKRRQIVFCAIRAHFRGIIFKGISISFLRFHSQRKNNHAVFLYFNCFFKWIEWTKNHFFYEMKPLTSNWQDCVFIIKTVQFNAKKVYGKQKLLYIAHCIRILCISRSFSIFQKSMLSF